MNHPVLLPKRKDFGFLKAPTTPIKSTSLSKLASQNRRHEFITETSKPIALVHSVGALKLKYELKSSHLLDKKPSAKNFDYIKLDRSGTFNTLKFDLKKDHLDRQAYITSTGTNIKNLKKQHHLLNIYSLSAKKSKSPVSGANMKSIRARSFLNNLKDIKKSNSDLESEHTHSNENCRAECLSCKFKKDLKLDQYVTLKSLKKPVNFNIEYERIKTMDSMHTIDYDTKTPIRHSTDFSELKSARSRKSGHETKNVKINEDQNYYDDVEDDDVIPKLTLWLV